MTSGNNEQFAQTAFAIRVLCSILLALVLVCMAMELVALAQTLWKDRRKVRWDVHDRQAIGFQLILLGISLANTGSIIWFLLSTLSTPVVPCSAVNKLLGIGYFFSVIMIYVFFIYRARMAGRMYNTTNYARCRRLTEVLVILFIPCIILPIFLVEGSSWAEDPDGRCLLRVPLHLLVIFLFGNLIISISVVALFLYPIVHAATGEDGAPRRSSRQFLKLAKYNARISILGVCSTTVAVIVFCVLNSIAVHNHEYDYLLLIAHGISLLDIVAVGMCIRATINLWIPSRCKRGVDWSQMSSTSLLNSNTPSSFRRRLDRVFSSSTPRGIVGESRHRPQPFSSGSQGVRLSTESRSAFERKLSLKIPLFKSSAPASPAANAQKDKKRDRDSSCPASPVTTTLGKSVASSAVTSMTSEDDRVKSLGNYLSSGGSMTSVFEGDERVVSEHADTTQNEPVEKASSQPRDLALI